MRKMKSEKRKVFITSILIMLFLFVLFNHSIQVYAGTSKACVSCKGTGECPLCFGEGVYNYLGYNLKCTCCKGGGTCEYCLGTGNEDGFTKPSNVIMTITKDGYPSFTFDVLPGLYSYKLYRSDSLDGEYHFVNYALPSYNKNKVIVDDTVEDGKTYYYTLRLANDFCYGESEVFEFNKAFSKPIWLDKTCKSYSSMNKLTWKKAPNVISYDIYRSTNKTSEYKKIGSSKTDYYHDENLNADTVYYYKIKAFGESNESDYSVPLLLKTKASDKFYGNSSTFPDFSKYTGITPATDIIKKVDKTGIECHYLIYSGVNVNMVAQFLNLIEEPQHQLTLIDSKTLGPGPVSMRYFDYTGSAEITRAVGCCDDWSWDAVSDVSISYIWNKHLLTIQIPKEMELVSPQNKYTGSYEENNIEVEVPKVEIVIPADTRCDICRGDTSCTICYGKRGRIIPSYGQGPSKFVECAACDGTGRCWKCHGSGKK